jgi:plasmid stabilization system protein ParE
MTINVLDSGEEDILHAMHFYEQQSHGLGSYYLDSIMSDIESLHIYAGIHIKIWGYYRLLSKRFPYSIYYKVTDETIFIYAVLDNRREPLVIQDRLESK